MNELDVIALVFVSSGAGYLLGKQWERARAGRAFMHFKQAHMEAMQRTTNGIMAACRKRLPDLNHDEFIQDVVNECTKLGVEMVAVNGDTGRKVVATNDDTTKQ
jgi:hypothetical protein